MRSGNPVFSEKMLDQYGYGRATSSGVMTVQGTALKTGMLLVLVVVAAAFTWMRLEQLGPQAAVPWMMGGALVGLVLALVTCFKMEWAPWTAPLYAVADGLFRGGISGMFNARFPGIAFQAICLTFGTMFMMLIAYQSGWVRATEKFRTGVMAATGAIFLVDLVSWVMNMFEHPIPYIHGSGPVGILFSLFVVGIAAMNLVLDFDFIEQGAARGLPQSMEWYGAFGLLVTLVWLYVEILRLLSKLSSRD